MVVKYQFCQPNWAGCQVYSKQESGPPTQEVTLLRVHGSRASPLVSATRCAHGEHKLFPSTTTEQNPGALRNGRAQDAN